MPARVTRSAHILSFKIQEAAGDLSRFPTSRSLYLPGGKSPRPGDLFDQSRPGPFPGKNRPRGKRGLYRGEIAEEIVRFSRENGGLLSARDFEEARSPGERRYRRLTTVIRFMKRPQLPGMAALMILNLLEGYDLPSMGYQSADHLHFMIEAKK